MRLHDHLTHQFFKGGNFNYAEVSQRCHLRKKHRRWENPRLDVPMEKLMITSKVHVSLIIASLSVVKALSAISELGRSLYLLGEGICIIQNWHVVQGKVTIKAE